MADKFQLKAIITAVDKLSPKLEGIQAKVASFRKGLAKTGLGRLSLGDLATGGAVVAPLVTATKSAIDFESAMADVKKVVDFPTPDGFKEMQKDILRMSRVLPMAASDIANIMASGGQSGIARNELAKFAEDAVKMGIAFDQTAEEAGDQMAKWRTAFRLSQDEVVALADKINHLSNNGAATAKQISDIVTRIGPLGEVAGLASGEIAAMGATLAGMGISEEIAATGMKNFMLTLTSGKSATASQAKMFKALRLDAEDVARGMQEDAKGTMTMVLRAISMVDKTKQASVLSQLFGRESIGAIAPMLTNLSLLEKNFEQVADASAYGGSMMKEFEARSQTTENALQKLSNQFEAIKISAGSAFLPAIVSVTDALAPLTGGLFEIISDNPWLVKALAGATAGMIALKGSVVLAMGAAKLFNAVLSANPALLAVKLLALAIGAIATNWDEVCAGAERFFGLLGRIVDGVKAFLNTPVAQLFGSKGSEMSESSLSKPINGAPDSSKTVVTVDFKNAPQGMRVERPATRGPAQVSTDVGYRSLAYGSD